MTTKDETPASGTDARASEQTDRPAADPSEAPRPQQGLLSKEKDARRAELLNAAARYAQRGWAVVPVWWVDENGVCQCSKKERCLNQGKHPVHLDWPSRAERDPASVAYWWRDAKRLPADDWWPEANVGIVMGAMSGLWALDYDEYSGGLETLAGYERRHGELPVTRIHQTGSGGLHYIFTHPGFPVRNSAKRKLGRGLDVRGEHGFIVAPPSRSNKGPYEINPAHDIDPVPAPGWLLELLYTEDRSQRGVMPAGREPAAGTGIARKYAETAMEQETEKMREAQPGYRNDTLNEVAFTLGTLGGAGLLTEDAAYQAIFEAASSTGLGEDEIRRTFLNGWRAGMEEPRQIQWNAIGGDWPIRAWSDLGNADRMVDHFGDVLRWCPERKVWYAYQSGCWHPGTSDDGEWAAQQMLRRLADTEGKMYDPTRPEDDEGRPTESPQEAFFAWVDKQQQQAVKFCSASARLSRGLPIMRIGQNSFDPDPMLLNCLNGVADLRSGELLPHDPNLRMTLQAQASYRPGATAPRFQAFLDRVQPDPEVQRYLQKIFGYGVTALTGEQAIFLHHGELGANGKSVLFDTIREIIGGYAQVVPVETLLNTNVEGRVPNDVARMDGRRLLLAAETKMGKFLDEQKLKMLTGGETIVARYMRGEFFEFKPVGKIHLATNHLPRLSEDPATWRRIRLITWDVQIPVDERDPDLSRKLVNEEAEGILAWLIEGAMAWYREGLQVPDKLVVATENYRQEEDPLTQFISDCVNTGLPEDAMRIGCLVKDFWAAHTVWADQNGMPSMLQPNLTKLLKKHFTSFNRNGRRGFLDAAVKAEHISNAE